jgi:hypothetical protein
VTDSAARNDILAHYVVATGSDGYRAVYSLGEIDPRFGGKQITVAYDDTAGQLGWFPLTAAPGWPCRATLQAGATCPTW